MTDKEALHQKGRRFGISEGYRHAKTSQRSNKDKKKIKSLG